MKLRVNHILCLVFDSGVVAKIFPNGRILVRLDSLLFDRAC